MVAPYLAAVQLLQGPHIPGRNTLICFCMRDLINILPTGDEREAVPTSFSIAAASQLRGFKKKLNRLKSNVEDLANARDLPAQESLEDTYDLWKWICENPVVHSGQQSGAYRKAKRLLATVSRGDETALTNNVWIKELHTLQQWFSDRHHFSHAEREQPSIDAIRENVARLEHLLLEYTHEFFPLLAEFKKLVRNVQTTNEPPRQEDLQDLVSILRWGPEFERPLLPLLDERWLPGLHEGGYFANPPEDGLWLPSTYLARMAAVEPTLVAKVFREIGAANHFVLADMIAASLASPPDVAVSLVSPIAESSRSSRALLNWKGVCQLCAKLVEAGYANDGLDLIRSAFAPDLEGDHDSAPVDGVYAYREGFGLVMPNLADAVPDHVLTMLCEWLDLAVKHKRRVDLTTGEDGSYVWRPAIEDHPENSERDFAGVIVDFVRDVADDAIRNRRMSLEQVLEVLERSRFAIFTRLRLHLIAEFADEARNLVRDEMLNREYLDDYRCKREYARLVERGFEQLAPEEREEWLRWVDDGPEPSRLPVDREQVPDFVGRWKRDRLCWVRKHVEGDHRQRYQELVSEYGEPDPDGMIVRTRVTRFVAESPITLETLLGMTFPEVVRAVKEWRQEGSGWDGPSAEGFVRTFGEYVATQPQEFSKQATLLSEAPCEYIQVFLQKMAETVRDGIHVDAASVLELCKRAVDAPLPSGENQRSKHAWRWACDTVTEFVARLCQATSPNTTFYAPAEYRQRVWHLIDAVSCAPATSTLVRDVEDEDVRLHDYRQLAINSSRGRAVDAAFDYVRWIAKSLRTDGSAESLPDGWDSVPEVLGLVERELQQDRRSIEVMSTLGARIPDLYLIDRDWLSANAGRIFDLTAYEHDPSSAYGWAAWNSFLIWTQPHVEFYRLFEEQFRYAVEQASELDPDENAREQPMERLGVHLMVLYGRGNIELDDENVPLKEFLRSANPKTRRHAIDHIGWSFRRAGDAPEEVVDRLQKLWEFYWEASGRDDAVNDSHLFGSWFSSGVFPAEWALERLRQFVEINPAPEPSHAIAEQLVEVALTDVRVSLEFLDRIVRGDMEGWRVHGYRDSAKLILAESLKLDIDAKSRAERIIDILGRRGYFEFGDLL
ncbi:hypothetical protein Mal4_54160 [Maioricimonas rarisocia]|uniref:Uncharacterized protein n=2 Tax=Maioricimonas rarisocia TaxID=2528026 RepID=A0A517ZF06_9PLAN|nr:hypothetical protein Mal4_54160 [Maioricimonas rarisocia]